jgi:hypothetical protein
LHQRFLRLHQHGLLAQALGNIRDDVESADGGARRVMQTPKFNFIHPAGAARIAMRFDEGALLAGKGALPGGRSRGLLRGLVGQQCQQIVPYPTGDAVDPLHLFSGGAVDGKNVEIEIDRHDQHVGRLDQGCQQVALAGSGGDFGFQLGLGFLQNLPGLNDVLDIGAGAVPFGHRTTGVTVRIHTG